MKYLVVGGAGYIGSHLVKHLAESGDEVAVFDDLSRGHRKSVSKSARFIHGDISKPEDLKKAFVSDYDGIFHFAAFALVGESVARPDDYYRINVSGTVNLLEAMRKYGVGKIVFSSSAAVYGSPDKIPILEEHPKRPVNPYGHTKLICEWMLDDYSRAYGISFAALRYFNAAGAAMDGSIGEDHEPETHLVPNVLKAALRPKRIVKIFGTDYDTPDGTCIRDYVHVEDLVEAHAVAMSKIGKSENITLNLGTGKGQSVLEIIDACRKVTGAKIKTVSFPRRPGDPPELVASGKLAERMLGWKPKYSDIGTIVESAWRWFKTHPNGYSRRR